MGKKGSTKVEAPDPVQIAAADTAFNRIDQFTPTGNLTFTDRPGGPAGANNVATLTLPPEIQALFESQTQSDQQLLNLALGRQEGFEAGLPDLVTGLSSTLEDFDRGGVESALFDKGSNLLNRQFDRDEDLLRQSLANRGLTGAGTTELGEAAGTELGLFNSGKADAFENLALSSILAGGAEQDRLLNASQSTDLNQAGLTQSNRATQFNELASLLGLQQVAQPGLSNFFAPANADVTGAFGLENQANIANAANATSQRNALLGGLGSLGSALILR